MRTTFFVLIALALLGVACDALPTSNAVQSPAPTEASAATLAPATTAPQPTQTIAAPTLMPPTQPAPKAQPQETPRALPPLLPPPGQPKAPGGRLSPEDREKLRAQEKSFLPQLTAVEKWTEIATVGDRENFAPSIVKLREGGYRIFWNSISQKGITSATSKDGIAFIKDSGVRLTNGGAGQKDCIASHPWVVALEAGYRMYYQGDAFCEMKPGVEHEYRVFSAFSPDGTNFTREGVRVDIGANGLAQAAHGRVLRLDDGTYRMYFSANFANKHAPADVLGASSKDGLTWTLDTKPTLERGHDPTVIKLGNKIYVYTTFLGDNFVILESSDGFNFMPTSWVDFYDKNGKRYEEFGDVDILQIADGRVLMYGSGKGSQGINVMEKSGTGQPQPPPIGAPGVPTPDATRNAQVKLTLTGKYLMSFHACDTAKSECRDPRNHNVYLAQGDDGKSWSIVPGWLPYSGSVPDVIRRGNTIYIYTPGQMTRYNVETRVFQGPFQVSIKTGEMFVDPSFIVDEQGRLVMFFLYGRMGSDPAGCPPGQSKCQQRFGSATEVAGSDGAQFTLDDGERAVVEISDASPLRSASDPDIFFDGRQYVLYVSHGPSTAVWTAPTLRGTFTQSVMLALGSGGIPAGYFDSGAAKYWTYSHIPRNNVAIIRRAVHSSLAPLNESDWVTVLTGASVGLTATTNVESPGFAVNAP